MSKIILEDFNEGNGYYKVNLAYLNKEQVEEIEDLVSTWNPTDKDIKSCIGMCLTDANEQRFKDYGTNLKECLAWIEKQGKKSSWKPSKEEMDALYGLSYITDQYDEQKEQVIIRLYQDLKREFFNGSSYENMFPKEDDVRRRSIIQVLEYAKSLDVYNQYCKADIDKNIAWLKKQGKERKITHEEICKSYGISDIGEFSDGYHTFNGLYKQRMILFAVLVNTYKDRAWKSWKHEDGLDCFGGGWFIVGIDTPAGTYTYHYEAKDWDRFDCQVLEKAKHWDGHDESDVERLFSLVSNANKDEVRRCLINGMKFYYEDNVEANWGTEKFSMKVKDILAWLEKQGENNNQYWKPSKEQISALEHFIRSVGESGYASLYDNNTKLIFSLINDLYTLEKQDEKETFCDKCRKEHLSHSCQDITELGRCYLEHEKQGEQKPIIDGILTATNYDKMFQNCNVPRFKVGDWIVRGDTIAQILDIQEQYYVGLDINGKDFTSSRFLNDAKIHLWTIQDAKDGDVLVASDGSIFLFAGIRDAGCLFHVACRADGHLVLRNIKSGCWESISSVKPATKEQRDILFTKIKEAGYMWDAEKKELKTAE